MRQFLNNTDDIDVANLKTNNSYILCVDDDRFILEILREQLTRFLGYEIMIETAESGSEALEIIEELRLEGYTPGVVISDQIMPEMNGDEFLIRITELYPSAIRILLTGLAEKEHVINIINNAGLYRYISKPWEVNDLNLTVKEAFSAFQNKQEIENQRDQLLLLNNNLENKVKERTETIEKKNKVIHDSLKYSEHIQLGILKPESDLSNFFTESFLLYRPKDIVSGDFYWYKKRGDKIIMAIIDCTGHGIPGAMLSMVANNLLEQAYFKNITSPDKILQSIHDGIVHDLRQHENGIQVGMDATICVFDRSKNTLEYAGAKQPLLISSNEEMIQLKPNRMSLGGMVDIKRTYNKQLIHLTKGDVVYLFTDGYRDQIGGDNDKCMTMVLYKEYLIKIAGLPLKEQKEFLIELNNYWKMDNPQTDDILMLGIKI